MGRDICRRGKMGERFLPLKRCSRSMIEIRIENAACDPPFSGSVENMEAEQSIGKVRKGGIMAARLQRHLQD